MALRFAELVDIFEKAIPHMEDQIVEFRCFYDLEDIKFPSSPMKGTFQRWGDSVIHRDERHFARTVGIILGDDGKVYTVPPDSVSLYK